MGSPYLSSNESIILSTNNVIVNTVPAEAILTNVRLMLVDSRHAELRPQDIPFHAIETVTIGENTDQDPMLALSLVTGPGLTQSLGIVFPQPPRMKRVAERDEWAARLKELSIISARDSGKKAMEILPPWIPGPLPEETETGDAPAQGPATESKFRNPPLMPRKPQKPAAPKSRRALAAIVIVILVAALVAGAYLYAPSLFGKGDTPLPPVTPVPTTAPAQVLTTAPTPLPTTVPTVEATPGITVPVTPVPTAAAEISVPKKGVWVLVKYEGSFSGSAGAPGRFREIADTGSHVYQIPARDEIVSATIQKQDTTGRKLTVEVYNEGNLVQSGSVTAPKGTVSLNADLRAA